MLRSILRWLAGPLFREMFARAGTGRADAKPSPAPRPEPPVLPPGDRRLTALKGVLLAEVLLVVWLATVPGRAAAFHAAVLAAGVVGLSAASVRARTARGFLRRRGQRLVYLLYTLLEHRAGVYVGLVVGAIGAAVVCTRLRGFSWPATGVTVTIAGALGIALGLGVWSGRRLPHRWARAVLPLATLLLVGLVPWVLYRSEVFPGPAAGPTLAANLTLLVPLLCVLLFLARPEDTALEIAGICAALAVALWQADLPPTLQRLTLLVPAMVWLVLTTRIERPLRWLKHILEAEGLAQRADRPGALLAFRRAMACRPKDSLAREGFWRMVRHVPDDELVTDPALLESVPSDELTARARTLNRTSPSDPVEAHRLLRVVARRSPHDHADAWVELARFHVQRGEWDEAVSCLRCVLCSEGPRDPAVTADAWTLTLDTGELARRLGQPLLEAGRRMEAILAMERGGTSSEAVSRIKQSLYAELREEEYRQTKAVAREAVEDHFDHRWCRRLGREWAGQTDRFDRGVEMLRVARDRIDPCATTNEIAALYEQRDDVDAAMSFYEESKTLGLRRGAPERLPDPDDEAFVRAVTRLSEWHEANGRLDAAIENRRLLHGPGRRSLRSQVRLAELEERRGHLLAAIHEIEQALMYEPKNAEVWGIKRRLYSRVPVARVRDGLDQVRSTFDFAWCLSEGKTIVDDKRANREELDFARQLLWLAELGRKNDEAITVSLYLGRLHRRLGEIEVAIRHLEAARSAGESAEKRPRAEDDAAHHACRVLADLYIERGEHAAARDCLVRFRPHIDSGADTYFKLGQVEEALGRPDAARKQYEALIQVYAKHPLALKAHDAAVRLGSKLPAPPKANKQKPKRKTPSKPKS